MELILHIGRPKTASSTIQRFLADATPALAKRNCHVPDFMGRENHRLIVTLARQKFKEDDDAFWRRGLRTQAERELFAKRITNRFKNWLAALPADATVMMSCEQLSSMDTRKIEWLHSLFAEYCSSFKIIIYIRRQDLTHVSRYNTNILSNGNELYADHFSFPSSPPDNLLYGTLIDRWGAAFGAGSLSIRCLDPEQLVGGTVPLDFCAAADLDPNGLPTDTASQNESVAHATLEVVRQINARLQAENLDKYELARIARITHNIGKLSAFKGKRLRPARAEAEAFLQLFDDHNTQIANTYLNRDQLFADDMSMYPEETDILSESDIQEATIEFISALLKQPGVKY